MFGFDQWLACQDAYKYYKMLLVYVDDVLAISHEPEVLIDAISEYYKVKPGSNKEPDIYLGANVRKCKCPMVGKFWLHLFAITSRMQSRPSKVYLRRMEKAHRYCKMGI